MVTCSKINGSGLKINDNWGYAYTDLKECFDICDAEPSCKAFNVQDGTRCNWKISAESFQQLSECDSDVYVKIEGKIWKHEDWFQCVVTHAGT